MGCWSAARGLRVLTVALVVVSFWPKSPVHAQPDAAQSPATALHSGDAPRHASSARLPSTYTRVPSKRSRLLWTTPAWPTLALAGSALALGVSALATGLRAHDLQEVLDARCGPERSCMHEGFERDKTRGNRLVWATRGLSIGAAVLGLGAIGWWWFRPSEERRTSVALDVDVDGTGARAGLSGRF